MPMNTRPVTGELDGLLAFLDHQRQAVRYACFGLTDEQARVAPAASPLSLGGLVKHLAWGERTWLARIEGRPLPGDTDPSAAIADYMGTFQLTAGQTLAGVLADYEAAAAETDRSMRAAADLDRKVPLPRVALGSRPRRLYGALGPAAPDRGNRPARRSRRPAPGGPGRRAQRTADGRRGGLARRRLGHPLAPGVTGSALTPAGDRLRACPIPA